MSVAALVLMATGGGGARQPAPAMIGRGVVSTAAPEFAATVTPDGAELYFTRATADRGRLTIMRSRRAPDGTWSAPAVASFSGSHRDVDPFVAPDGRRLYFTSDRPRRAGDEPRFATWYVERRGDGWTAPIDPGPPLNSERGEVFVSASRDGLLVFTSTREGPSRVYATRERDGRWQPPAALTFGTSGDGGNPAISPSGRFIVLVRAPAGGAGDLFVTCRTADGWSEPRPLADSVNSAFAELAPSIDAGERVLYFTSERPGVVSGVAPGVRPPGDLYQIGLAEAGVRCP